MSSSTRRSDYILAACLAAVTFLVCPLGIELITGRPDLSVRVIVISVSLAGFLGLLTTAMLAQKRLRRVLLYVLAGALPLVMLAALEAVAVSVHLADIIAPLEDTSILANKTPWPTHLLTESSYYRTPDGFTLYRPWQGGGVSFNVLGLRTAMPTPKAPGEWRIAVTGGSAAWGWHVTDDDTIPVRLQEILRRDHPNVTVYNFGIGGATLKQELALLKHFRNTYALDQVVFYTGGNDVFFGYTGIINKDQPAWLHAVSAFELIKLALRLQAMWTTPSAQKVRWIDTQVLPAVLAEKALRKGILDADEYCRASQLRCDFVLQPTLAERKTRPPSEAAIAKVLDRVFPELDVLAEQMYADALASGPQGHVFDLTHIFDNTTQPLFLDFVHLNEEGYRLAAQKVAQIVTKQLP